MRKLISVSLILFALFTFIACNPDSSTNEPITAEERAVLTDIGNAIYSSIMTGNSNWNPSIPMQFGTEYVSTVDMTSGDSTLVAGSSFTVTLTADDFDFVCKMIVKGSPNTTITMTASGPVSGLVSGNGVETSGSYGDKALSKEDIMTVISGLLSGGQQ